MPLQPFEKTDSNAELRRVWKGKYPLPTGSQQLQFTPFAPKPGGGFVGALYKKAPTKPGKTAADAKTWLGKPGFAYRGFEKSTEIEKTRSITRRGLDAIAEKIAGDAYHAANTGRYFIPKHRLAKLPVRHDFLQPAHRNLVDFALDEINKNRPLPITEAIHVFSKWIEGFRDLASIQTRLNGAVMPFMEAITGHQRLPESVFVDGVDVPLMGLIDILAVSRLLADSDVLGGGGDNAGIIVYRDPQGQPVVAKAVKIDPGFAFNFRGHENKFQRTRAALALGDDLTEDLLLDLKDIQFGNNHPVNIRWEWLSASQQCDFLLALQKGDLALGEGKMIEMLLLRGGDFKLHGEDLVQEATATTLAKQWRDNIKQQNKCYEREVLRHREGLTQRQQVQEREWATFANRLKADNPRPPTAAAASAAARDAGAAAERDLPPGFICPISQEIMIDPMITPSGRSFERALIEDWVRQSGTDPLTRQALRLDQLIPNRDLKEAIERWFLMPGPTVAQERPGKIPAAEAPAPAAVPRVARVQAPQPATAAVAQASAQPAQAMPTPAARPTAQPAPARAARVAAAAAGLFATARPAQAAAAVVNQADVNKLLLHIARGEQPEAEDMLQIPGNEVLLLHKGTVTDYSDRTFENITGFQYALWALDWHMWKMLKKYLPNEEALAQLEELETQGTVHGKHYDFRPLIQALQTYVDQFSAWYTAHNWSAIENHWSKVVGGAQRQVPVHVANEYCRQDRAFHPAPSFTEETLPRELRFWIDRMKYFPLMVIDGDELGRNFGVLRGAGEGPARDSRSARVVRCLERQAASDDCEAIKGLREIRSAQLQALDQELRAAPRAGFGKRN